MSDFIFSNLPMSVKQNFSILLNVHCIKGNRHTMIYRGILNLSFNHNELCFICTFSSQFTKFNLVCELRTKQ